MKQSIFIIVILLPFFLSISSCSETTSIPPDGIAQSNLIKIEDALNHSNTNFVNLVNATRGSVGTNGSGSKVIWSRKNDFNLGLFVSANHVYGISSWNSFQEEFIDLAAINNGIFLGSKIPPRNGNISLTDELIASFGLYHPHIPSTATNTTVLPENDFYLGIVDNQRAVDNGFGTYPNFLQTTVPLQLFDPTSRTLSNQTWSAAIPDAIVLAVGYPQNTITYPNGAVSSGKVYTDSEAQNIIQLLALNGDSEGSIPYNPQVEFLANIEAIAGMSGGGVFNTNGQLIGIMVRATTLNDEPILRVVRMSYIVQKVNDFYTTLSSSDKSKLQPFISGELN